MKIFLFGSTGMLGSYVKQYLLQNNKTIVCINRNELDVSDVSYEKIQDIITRQGAVKNDIIVNCIGVIPQSKETNKVDVRNYFLINSVFPIMLSSIAQVKKMKFVHVTTDCVFSGNKGNYNEHDFHDETSFYGVSKSLGELGGNMTIMRTSIIGEERKNKYSLLEWVKSQENSVINGYTNHYWNGVTCLELSKIINYMIDNDIFWHGVRHVFTPKSLSKFELVSIINHVYNLNNTIIEHETDNNVNKTLTSCYEISESFCIPELQQQIYEIKHFKLSEG